MGKATKPEEGKWAGLELAVLSSFGENQWRHDHRLRRRGFPVLATQKAPPQRHRRGSFTRGASVTTETREKGRSAPASLAGIKGRESGARTRSQPL
jgi:hypothetical protein